MSKFIVAEYSIEFPASDIPIVEITLTEFMNNVFKEYARVNKLIGNVTDIIRVSDNPVKYRIVLYLNYQNYNPMTAVRFDQFIKKVFELARMTNLLYFKLFVLKGGHPECREDEILLLNISADNEEDFKHIGWKTKRIGSIAYKANGEVLTYMSPVFVNVYEFIEGMKRNI